MIHSLILDIDGVLVGEKIGYNSPDPNPQVLARLKNIRSHNVPIILCTAKPHYSIQSIINGAQLSNPHITFAGGVVIDPIQNTTIESHPFPKQLAQDLVNLCVHNHFYLEVYTHDTYYVLKTYENELTKVHTHILQHAAVLIDSFDFLRTEDIFKILPIVPDESGIKPVNDALAPFKDSIETTWSIHPIANPHQFCNISPIGISKRQATLNILSHLKLDPAKSLSVGDSTSDWKFMELTGFAATLENGQEPLKKFVHSKKDNGFIGGHVDENGILSILDHFHL